MTQPTTDQLLDLASDPPVPAIPRRRVVVAAYACSPDRGSEPGMGWHFTQALAKYHDLTVLTAAGMPGKLETCYRDEIAAHDRRHGPTPGVTYHFVDRPLWSRLFQRETGLIHRTMYYSGYAAWQRAVYREALRLHTEKPFDLAHQLNISGFREPSYLYRLPIPFAWGPVNGAADIPFAFFPLMGKWEKAFYFARNLGNVVQKRTARRPRKAAAAARWISAVGEENRDMIRDHWGRDADVMLDTGTVARPGVAPRTRDTTRPLRVAWSGLHIGRKALPVLLHAVASLKGDPAVELTVLGGGPETNNWKALADRLGIASHVRWTGMLPHADAVKELGQADLVAFTSVQEGTPHVVLESLSLGLPVICHRACGMGVAVTDDCGVRVPMVSPAVSAAGFEAAIRKLAVDPAELARLSAGALRRSNELSWELMATRIARGYARALGAVDVTSGATSPQAARSAAAGAAATEFRRPERVTV